MDYAVQQGRSGWRRFVNYPLVAMLISVVLLILVSVISFFAVGLAAGFLTPGTEPVTRDVMAKLLEGPYLVPVSIVEILLSLLVYKTIIRHLGDRPRDDLQLPGSGGDLGLGLIAGFLIFSIIVGIAALLGVYHIDGKGGWGSFVQILFAMGIMPGFREELLFRGVLFRFIEEWGGSWAALAITSALFGAAHLMNPNATWFSSFAIAVEAGVLLGAAYMLTRNLWMAMGLHAAWNFTQGFIWDVPVSGLDTHGLVVASLTGPTLLSGGSFGLEASVIALVCATTLGLVYLRASIRIGRLVQPRWVRRRIAAAKASPERLA